MYKKILAFLAFICIISAISAQNILFDYGAPKKYCIKDITVSGIKFLEPNILISVSGLAIGDSISVPGDDITKPIKKLWAQGLFSDVKISATKIENDDIYLDIKLLERSRISAIEIKGVRKGEIDDLKEQLKLRVGGQVTENILENSVRIIKKHFNGKGYLNADVEVVQNNDSIISNGIKLTFNIKKNKKVKIKDITFEGNFAYKEKRLRRALKKIHRRDFNIFKSAKFIESDYEESKNNLLAFYNEHGYRDAHIVSDSIQKINSKRIKIKFSIEEGNQYHIRNITWLGNTKLPSETLAQILAMKKGDVYDKAMLDKQLFTDDKSISTLYMDDGYLFFQIDPVEVTVDKDSVDLEMRIYEGEQATINEIFIVGNTKTNEHVARRELFSKPGDLFSKSDIMRSSRQLAQLGHFDPERLDVKPFPNPANGTVDLKFILEEKANDQFEISGGWGAGMFVGTAGIRFSNFSVRRIFEKGAWRPVPSGDSQSLSLRASTNGSYYKAFSLSFSEPWLGGKKPTNFSFSLYHQIQNGANFLTQTSNQYFKITGGSIGLGTRLKYPDDYFVLSHEFSIQNYLLKDWTSSQFAFSTGTSNNISYKITLGRNSTGQPIYPRDGSNFSLSLQLTFPYSSFKKDKFWAYGSTEKSDLINNYTTEYLTNPGATAEQADAYARMKVNEQELARKYKWIEFHKWTGRAQWFMSLAGDLVLYTNAQFGALGYYNSSLGHSPFEGFDLGGDGMSGMNLYGRETIGLRGYENGRLTPIKYQTMPNGQTQIIKNGNIYNKYTMEIRYPLSLKPQAVIYGLAFIEAGNSFTDIARYNPFNVHRSIGFGARMFLPMLGMIGIDYAIGIDEVPNDPTANDQRFFFVLGMPF